MPSARETYPERMTPPGSDEMLTNMAVRNLLQTELESPEAFHRWLRLQPQDQSVNPADSSEMFLAQWMRTLYPPPHYDVRITSQDNFTVNGAHSNSGRVAQGRYSNWAQRFLRKTLDYPRPGGLMTFALALSLLEDALRETGIAVPGAPEGELMPISTSHVNIIAAPNQLEPIIDVLQALDREDLTAGLLVMREMMAVLLPVVGAVHTYTTGQTRRSRLVEGLPARRRPTEQYARVISEALSAGLPAVEAPPEQNQTDEAASRVAIRERASEVDGARNRTLSDPSAASPGFVEA